ncbi:MAG: non-hydrolyzing UDP-N-acetylglucosamine 2-epimerase [Bacillota bacterium]
MLKILAVFGTRPEAIKMAPVVLELQKYPDEFLCKVVVTAQHREMLDQVLELFNIRPHYDLNLMRDRQSLYDITTSALPALGDIYVGEAPDVVLVHGDTTTTFVAALAAYYQQVPVGHVEAGLRTRDKYSPFPEEMNRRLTGVLADIHFAPTGTARGKLLEEAVAPGNIYVTGNTVIDALQSTVDRQYEFTNPELAALQNSDCRVLLVTAHRRENWGGPMREIFMAIKDLVLMFTDIEIVFPVHKNPRVRELAHEVLANLPRVHLIEPLEYQPFVKLMHRAHLILTDSGGLQEEAPALGKPVLVLRDTTERPEAVEAGTVRLVGTSREAIVRETAVLLQDSNAYRQMANAVNPYGDGQAAKRTILGLLHYFGKADQRPADFRPEAMPGVPGQNDL